MVIEILKDIISLDSQNPDGNSQCVLNYIIDKIKNFNFDYSIYKTDNEKANLVVKIDGIYSENIVINGHMDTKPYGELMKWEFNPLEAVEHDNKIYGVGACDMKGGVASMIAMLVEIGKKSIKPNWNLEFHFVDDEENNSLYGMKHLIENKIIKSKYDFAIVCEPSENSIVMDSLGNSWKEVCLIGKTAHAGHYFEGVNSNTKLMEFLLESQKRVNKMKGKDMTFPQYPNINVGIISGGDHPGTVADRSKAVIDIRVSREEDKETIINEMNQLFMDMKLTGEIRDYLPGMYSWNYKELRTEFSDRILGKIASNFSKFTQSQIKYNCFYGGSDAGYYAHKLKTPTIVFGPGSLKQAHQPNEWIAIESVKLHFYVMKSIFWIN